MNPWLAVPLIVAALLLAWLVVRQVDRRVAYQQAADAEYWRGQLAELARLGKSGEDAELERQR